MGRNAESGSDPTRYRLDQPNVGRIFKAYLEGHIDYDEFLRLSAAIDRLLAGDLEGFLSRDWTHVPVCEATVYLSSGLVEFDEAQISVEDEWDRDMQRKYRIEGGESTVSTTKLGRTLQALLRAETFAGNPNDSCHV